MGKWERVRLGDVAQINPPIEKKICSHDFVSIIPMDAISTDGKIVYTDQMPLQSVKNGLTAFQEKDILFAKITPCMENGKCAIASGLVNNVGYGSTEFHVLRPASLVDTSWLFHLVHSPDFRRVAKQHMTGSAGQKRVPAAFLKNYQISLPPLPGQQKIADILDRASALIEKRKAQIDKLDLLVKARFVEMFGDPVTNTHGWARGTIRDIVTEVKYGTSKPANAGGQYPYLRMNNITYDGQLDTTDLKYINVPDNEVEKCIVKKGDVLFNRTNSKELVGKTCVFNLPEPMIIAGYIIRVRLNNRAISEYLSAMLNSDYGKQVLRAMCKSIIGQANINAQELQDIKMLIPPIDLQNRFAAFVACVETQKERQKKGLVLMELNYKALMQKCFEREML